MAANDSFSPVFLRLMLLLVPVLRLYASAASAVPQKQRGRLGAALVCGHHESSF